MATDRINGTGWFAAPNWIFERQDLLHTDKLVFLYLCRRAGTDGRSWPSIRRMADDVGLSRNTVRACLERLERAGVIRREARTTENGDADSYVYHIFREVGRSEAHVGQSEAHVGQSKAHVGQSEAHVGGSNGYPPGSIGYPLVGQSVTGGGSIRDPEGLPKEGLPSKKDKETGSFSEGEVQDALQQVARHHEQVIGVFGPATFDKFQFWLEERGVSADLICAAIDKAVESGVRRFSYAEGILRNWYNDGIRTVADIRERARADPRSPDYDTQEALRRRLAEVEALLGEG